MCKCAECGATFKRLQAKQLFCEPACRTAYHNRSAKRGKTLVPLLLAWRTKRTGEVSKRALREACQLIAQFNAEDEAADRMSGNAFVARQYAHWLRS